MPFSGAIMINERDSIAVCLEAVDAGADVEVRLGEETRIVTALQAIPFGFKIALADIPKGDHVLKYGESIGLASMPIKKGDMIHTHNLEGGKGRGDLEGVER